MPNIHSNGKFGTSMDYSQMLEIRRKYINSNAMRVENPTNSPNTKPFFNQNKMVREGSTNGAVDYYFSRGLTPLFRRITTGK